MLRNKGVSFHETIPLKTGLCVHLEEDIRWDLWDPVGLEAELHEAGEVVEDLGLQHLHLVVGEVEHAQLAQVLLAGGQWDRIMGFG